jgi:CHAT domain
MSSLVFTSINVHIPPLLVWPCGDEHHRRIWIAAAGTMNAAQSPRVMLRLLAGHDLPHLERITTGDDHPVGPTSGTGGVLLRGTRSACGTFQTLRFHALPGSQQEAENIAAFWKQAAGEGSQTLRGASVQLESSELLQMIGADASPEAFVQLAPGKRVLHVATHGFSLEGSCQSAVQLGLDSRKRDDSLLPVTAENPLLLSGLAFAGANRRGSAKPDETDGILIAEEIAGINLEGVDWAVLSACDTGVGEIKVGEGVFGLRRAFQVAGAKTVIMSLWPVEDETTRQWMGTLYREHFLSGMGKANRYGPPACRFSDSVERSTKALIRLLGSLYRRGRLALVE